MKKSKIILVGNGPSILEHEYGQLIDSYDVVVRFNWYHTKGFEKHTGVKTNVWVTTIFDVPRSKFEYDHVIYHSWGRNIDNDKNYLKFKERFNTFDKLDYVPIVDEIQQYTNNKKYKTYSTGALILWQYLKKYETVDIIGFDWWSKSENDNHHYGDKQKIGRIHKPSIELELFSKLISEKRVYDLHQSPILNSQLINSNEEVIESEKYDFLYEKGYPPGDPISPIKWANKEDENLKILDIGCGRGVLSNKFKDYTGIDVSGFVIELNNKKRLNGKYYNCGILNAKNLFKDIKFDLAVALDVLEHLPKTNLDEYLHSLSQINAKEFLFSICCRDSFFRDKDNNSLHLTILTREEWVDNLNKYFDIINVSELNKQKTFSILLKSKLL
jgi:SAM-dependent methyltransferase